MSGDEGLPARAFLLCATSRSPAFLFRSRTSTRFSGGTAVQSTQVYFVGRSGRVGHFSCPHQSHVTWKVGIASLS